MKHRVLQLIPSFHQGGSERQAIQVTQMLREDRTFDVLAATLNNEGSLKTEFTAAGFDEIPEFPLTSFYDLNFARQVRQCSRYLRDEKIDVVQTHDFYTNVFGMAAASVAGVRVRVASKRETKGVRTPKQEFVEKLAFGRADAIVTNSRCGRDYLVSKNVAAEKIHVLHNGLDLSRFDRPYDAERVKRDLGLPVGDDLRFITLVANLRHTVKNVPMFLRTAGRVLEKCENARFVIAGEGDLESEMKQGAAVLGIGDRVFFIGRCSDIPGLLSISYACMLTSFAEGFSNSILEYMAAGKPVVATNVGGAPEAIETGRTGYLVESDDDAAAADRLAELLENEKLATEFGKKGREKVIKQFSPEAQLSKTIELYKHELDRNLN